MTDLFVARHHHDAPGPQVVLVHGAPDRSKSFASVVHSLADMAVTVYDRRGYGKSVDAPGTPGGFAGHADDLIELLDGVPSVVVGQSAGGTIAMLASIRAPELFLALGAWEPPMIGWDWWMGPEYQERTMAFASYEDAEALGEAFNRFILGDARWEQLSPRTKDLLRREGAAFRADMACQSGPLFDLDHINVPMIVGAGTVAADERFPGAHRRTADRCRAEHFEVEGADHYAHISDPPGWSSLVRVTVALAAAQRERDSR
jgi:pimeloyl-ACP methyl ester carboxylesterase